MKLHLPKRLAAAVIAAIVATMVQSAYADVVTTTYVSTTNGVGTADASMQKQDGSGTEGADSFSKTVIMSAFTQATNLVLSGNNGGSISTVDTNGGWGGRVAFSGQSDNVTDITINKGIEADISNIQGQSALTVHADNASFFGTSDPYAFTLDIGSNGVRMNGGSSANYTISGAITGSGNLGSCTGNNTTSLTLTGDLSNYTGSLVGVSAGGKQREIIFGNGGSAADVTKGVVGAGVGSASSVTRSVKFNYTGDLEVRGALYATTVTAQNLTNLKLSGGGMVDTLNMGSTNLENTGTLTVAHLSTGAATVTNTGTMTFTGTVVSSDTLTLSGNFTVDSTDLTNFELKDSGSVTWSDAENQQGFQHMTGATYYAVKGTVAEGQFSLGDSVTRAEDNSGMVFSVGSSEGTQYYVNAATATLTEVDTGKATAYSITAASAEITVTGGTFDNNLLQSADRGKLSSLVLSGGNAILKNNRAFSGDVTINSGSTLTIGTTDAIVYSGTSDSKTITVNQGGTLDFGSNRLSIGNEAGGSAVYNIVVNGGTITGNGDTNRALHFFDPAKITATGTTGVISATTKIRDTGDTLTVEVTGADDVLLMSGLVDGNGILKKTGDGTLKVTGTNKTNAGGTVVEAGTLLVSSGGQSGALAGTLTVKAGGKVTLEAGDALGWGTGQHVSTLNLEGGNLHVTTVPQANQTFANTTLNLTGGTITGVSGSNIDLYSGSSTVHALAAADATAVSPTVSTVSGVTLSLREASTTFTVDENAKLVLETGLMNGNKSESFANALVVEGAGTLVFNGAGTYQGGTTINGGTVVAGNNAALGTGAVTLAGGALEVVENVTIGNAVTMTGGELTVNGTASNVTANGGSVTIGDNGSVTSLTANDNVTVSGNVDASAIGIAAQKHVTVDSITKGDIQFTAAEDGKVEVANTNAEGSIQYGVGEAAAKVTADSLVANSTSEVTVANQLAVKSISNEGTGALVIDGTVAGVESITAESGDITLNKMSAEIQLNELSVGSKIVRVNTSLADGGAAESTIKIATDGTISASTGGTLYANLTLLSGSTLDITDALTLGSTLTLDAQGGINLGSSLASEVAALEAGDSVTLIKAATGTILDYAGVNYNGAASAYFANVGEGYQIVADGTHVAIQKTGSDPVVPEPTTGTLSLLALAGLMARRRRK